MTLKELSQLYWLIKEIKMDEERLRELESSAMSVSAQVITGMPHGPRSNRSPIEAITAEIIDLKTIIAAKQIQCVHERARLERYIASIDDSLTRMVFTARFVEGKTWADVADAIGGNTEDSVKKVCYRYLNREQEDVCTNS